MDYKLKAEEKETIIRGYCKGKEMELVTADPKYIRLMKKQGYSENDTPNPWGYVSFTFPASRLRILRKEKRKMPEGQFKSKQHPVEALPTSQNEKDIPEYRVDAFEGL